jgi:hypothetical protein
LRIVWQRTDDLDGCMRARIDEVLDELAGAAHDG